MNVAKIKVVRRDVSERKCLFLCITIETKNILANRNGCVVTCLYQNMTRICFKSFKVSERRLFKNVSEFQDISVREFQTW